jgi:small subunit ribosomal protein S9
MSTISNPNIAGLSTVAAPAAPAQAERPLRTALPADKHGWWWGTGRRKTAVARCRLKPAKDDKGTVKVQVAEKKFKAIEEYFCELRDRADAVSALTVTKTAGKFDIILRMSGGGYMGQAQAARLAIARAIRDYDPTLEQALRDNNMLTRDAREVERKKYGQAGARRRFQFSKR